MLPSAPDCFLVPSRQNTLCLLSEPALWKVPYRDEEGHLVFGYGHACHLGNDRDRGIVHRAPNG
jgi:hypothetical protein